MTDTTTLLPAPSTVEEVTVSDVLHGAADVIEIDGWLQFGPCTYREGPRSVCAMMGILRAANGLDDGDSELCGVNSEIYSEALQAFSVYLTGRPNRTHQIPIWNDAAGRTKADVVAALRAAAVSS